MFGILLGLHYCFEEIQARVSASRKKMGRIRRSAVQQKKVILQYFYRFAVVSFLLIVYQVTYTIAERSERLWYFQIIC